MSHQAATAAHRPALIDDHTPTPEHASFQRGRLLRYTAIGFGLWGVALGGLYALHGGEGSLPRMGLVFYQSGALDLRWGLYGPALRLPRGGRILRLAHDRADHRRSCARRNHARTLDYGGVSFLFILIGGPLVEATHGDLKFTAPLTAITAAVVGVVLNLAVFFALHVLWPAGFPGTFEGVAALIGAAAFLAMWRYQWGIIPVIGACGALGFVATYLR